MRKMKKRITPFFIAILFLACSFYEISANNSEPVKRTRKVDVSVTRDGQMVKNLTKNDFTLFEQGKEIEIDSSEVIEPKKRLAVIFHDPEFWSRELMTEREKITEELIGLARQGYELLFFRLNWITGLEPFLPYVSQEEAVREMSDLAMLGIGSDKSLEDLSDRSLASDIVGQASGFLRVERQGEMQAYLNINRRRFEKAMGGILAACNFLNAREEGGLILFISKGIPDLSSSNQALVLDEATDARSTLDAIHSRDREYIGTTRIFDPFNLLEKREFNRAEQVLTAVVNFANSQNVSVYCLDPEVFSRSLSTHSSEYFRPENSQAARVLEEENVKQKQNLRLLSEKTNAAFFRGANKFKELNEEMARVAGSFYQLKFIPDRKKPDGQTHDLKVEMKAVNADIRYKKTYTDYGPDEMEKISLVSAYYNPELFGELHFEADFLPFMTRSGKFAPWINLALPTKVFFKDRLTHSLMKTYHLHFWITKIKEEEKGFKGQINISLDMNQKFLDYVNARPYLWFFFSGKEMAFVQDEYQAAYAIIDTETNEIGARQVFFSIPEFKKNKAGVFINCVMGSVFERPEIEEESFAINPKTGYLEYKGLAFVPRVTSFFSPGEDGFVFLQIYTDRGEGMVEPEFRILKGNGIESQSLDIPGKLVAGSYSQKAKTWSGVYRVDLSNVPGGRNIFQAVIRSADGNFITSEKIKLIKTQN